MEHDLLDFGALRIRRRVDHALDLPGRDVLAAAADAGIVSTPPIGQEAFEIAQWASQSSAAAALQQAAVRFASGDGALVSLARENQDLSATWRDADRRLLDALASPDSPQNRAAKIAGSRVLANGCATISRYFAA